MCYRRAAVEGASYFFTLVTYRRQALFRDAEAVGLFNEAVRVVQTRRPFTIVAQVILPDHLHAIWTPPDHDSDYATRWRRMKETFTRAYFPSRRLPEPDRGRRARGERTVWQRRYWEHLIRDDRDFVTHVEYIHCNPVHHGLASAPRDWPHSTFGEWVARGAYEVSWGSDQGPELPAWAGRE
jgi:putative transposase